MLIRQYNVYGRVQGVGFRYFTWKKAQQLDLKGFVRNLSDGSVSILVQGTQEQLAQFRHWLEEGPKTAHVERVLEQHYDEERVFTTFEIRY
ncbi:acylphosphatase [Conservatibacter flavescens]|uniref:Acylphosphatase n=1 Tax=Conservatibacter flavescens TaxID=28161 RepID=A0A2M8S566_9PAST|nr:acylphosphatase [Conservatibacter flavescens]PJG86282.1 acylphosphatase [Conservatibacter flavescens]